MGYNNLMDIKANQIGKAGELRVRSELILRGFNPAVFDQDSGVDIILENGERLQVKTSLNPSYSKKGYSWKYTFRIRAAQFRPKENGLYERKFTKDSYKGKVDYFVFWLVKDNIFYIIPEKEVGGKISLVIPTPKDKRKYEKHTWKKSTSKYEKYKSNWEQLNGTNLAHH